MKLVAILVLVAAGAICNFPLARRHHRVLPGRIIVPMIRKGEELLTAQTIPLATNGSHPKLSDALIRLGTVSLVLYHRKTTVPLRIGHESLHADAVAQVAAGVRGGVGADFVVRAGKRDRGFVVPGACDDGVARVLEVKEVRQAGTVQVGIVAVREGIVHDALLVHFAGSVERYGLADALFCLPAGDESFLADAHLGRLVAERVLRIARTSTADLVGVDVVGG